MRQNVPFVNGKLSNLQGIRLIRLHLTNRDAFLVILDSQRIDRGYEETCPVHAHGKGFVVSPGMLHDYSGFPIQTVELINQSAQSFWGVGNLKRLQDHF